MNYFAYGSNMDQDQMRERCPNSILIRKAVLKNYKLDFLEYSPRWQGGCADVIPDNKSEVWGLLYEVSKSDIQELDKFEGNPDFYRRYTMQVELDGIETEAEVYTLVTKKSFIKPTLRYFNIITDTARLYGFPSNYQNRLKQFSVKDKSS